MDMNLFVPRDKVFIPELDTTGTVVEVNMNMRGINYTVRYFKDDCPCECEFFDFEISAIKKANPVITQP